MKSWYKDVKGFHQKFGCHVGQKPGYPPAKVLLGRKNRIREEFNELMEAIDNDATLDKIVHESIDLIYVVLGGLVEHGVDPSEAWDAIQKANMSKSGGGKAEDGKILKPEGWKPADIASILKQRGWNGN